MTAINPAADGASNPCIRKLERFAILSDDDRWMLERVSTETFIVAPDTDLVREGDKPDGVFLIMEGMACRHKRLENGVRQIMAYLVPGDLCDLDVALLKRMDHTITTLSACKVVRLAPETVADRACRELGFETRNDLCRGAFTLCSPAEVRSTL